MQLHHLHSLPCYKAHPGTKDLQIFRVFPSHQAATAQGITGLTKLFEATSFNSIQYTHPSFWTSPRETTESHWNSSDNCMLLSFCPIFFYKLLWENRNTQECYRKVSFWIWFMTWLPGSYINPIKYIVLGPVSENDRKTQQPPPQTKKTRCYFCANKKVVSSQLFK